MKALLLLVLPAALSLSGCNNDCQQLCNEMATYWEDCGKTFGDADVKECKQHFSSNADEDTDGLTPLDKYEGACRQLTSKVENEDGDMVIALRAQFSCEDIQNGPGGAFMGS